VQPQIVLLLYNTTLFVYTSFTQVKQEHKRTLRMLLMIPINVIDATPSIKEYLDSLARRHQRVPWYKLGMIRGPDARWRRRGSASKHDRLLEGHEPLLQAFGREADEALLVVSSEGTIEMVSLSTERIFGYERRQLLGHRIATVSFLLLPEITSPPRSRSLLSLSFLSLSHCFFFD
jgi:PAS domain-containing protein